MAGYTYILRCTDGRLYYASTNDLGQRLDAHRAGRVRSTRARRPVDLVYFEQHETLALARRRERAFKAGRTRRKTIDHLIQLFPPEKLAPFA
jgi:putative endonuclease